MEKSEQVTIDKIDIIPISLNISQYHYLVHWTLPYQQKGHPLTCKIYSSGMSFLPILHHTFNTWCCLSTTYMIPKCLNACIIASSFSGVIYSYVAFPLNSDKSISSREKSTFTFLLSTILRSTSVRAEQRSTGPLASSGSKTTVSTWHDTFWLMSDFVPVRGNISGQNRNRSTPSEAAHSQLQTDAICGKSDIHIKALAIEVYGNKSV